MKYYWIQPSINLRQVGVFPQCSEANNAVEMQEYGFGFFDKISKEFKLPEPIVQRKAKPTDMLSVVPIPAPIFLVLTERLLDCFISNSIEAYQSWELATFKNGESLNGYNLFHISRPVDSSAIDFDHSEFILKNNRTKEEKSMKFETYQSYHDTWKLAVYSNQSLVIKQAFLRFSDLSLDAFRILELNSSGIGYYVSEKLKMEIERKGFTGIEFTLADKLDPRIIII